jgi:Lon-like protease
MRQSGMDAPLSGGVAIILAVATIIVAVFNLEIPYLALTPGPAANVLELIEIEGAKTTPTSGKLLLTTVQLHQITVAESIRGWFDTSYEIISRSAFIPPGQSDADADRRTTDQMKDSQQHAAVAALSLLGYDVRITPQAARVAEVSPDSPADKVLRSGDLIVGVDASKVSKAADFSAVMKHHKVGDAISIKVVRDGRHITVRTKTVGRPEQADEPIIGVLLETVDRVDLPIAVDIDSLGIGGPSAGLIYALGIVDLLDSSDLTKGRTIAGTGAISLQGVVEPVGGVRQKIAAARREKADLFVAPLVELKQACARAGKMPVVGVVTLREAVRALRGVPVPRGRSCG